MRFNPLRWFSGTKTVSITEFIEQCFNGNTTQLTSYSSLAASGYSGNADVFACIREVAVAVRGIPWRVNKLTSSGKVEAVDKHPLLDLIKRPNPQMSGSKFFEWLCSYHLMAGTAYIYRAGPNNTARPPKELYLLRPNAVEVKPGNTMGEIAGYDYRGANDKTERLAPEIVLSLPFFNPNSEYNGLSPITVASSGLQIGNEGRSWNCSLLRNGAKPPGAIKYTTNLNPEQRDRIEDAISNKLAGWKNAGRPPVLEGDASWIPFGFSPTDMDWKESIKLSTLDICRVFNVAPELIGLSEAKTYSNFKEARKALYHETVLPLMDYLADELNNWLVPLYGDNVILAYDADSIEALREDQEALYKRAYDGVTRGVLTPNEARAMIGLEPLQGADMLLVSGSTVALDTIMGGGVGGAL